MSGTSFLLGVVPSDSVENRKRKGWILIYTPAGLHGSNVPLIGLYEGPNGHYEGGSVEASVWLQRRPSTFDLVDSQIVENRPEPGWFERLCREVGCAWFVPIAQRLAAGENVPLEEIQCTYSLHHHGAHMPQGDLTDLFKIAKHN